jgi:hypothetical protein
LEHAIGESAGGGADVGAGEACDGDRPGFEGGLKLESTAGDVAKVVAEEANGGVFGDGGAGFGDLLLVDEDATGENEGLSALARGNEGTVYEEFVEAKLHEMA